MYIATLNIKVNISFKTAAQSLRVSKSSVLFTRSLTHSVITIKRSLLLLRIFFSNVFQPEIIKLILIYILQHPNLTPKTVLFTRSLRWEAVGVQRGGKPCYLINTSLRSKLSMRNIHENLETEKWNVTMTYVWIGITKRARAPSLGHRKWEDSCVIGVF